VEERLDVKPFDVKLATKAGAGAASTSLAIKPFHIVLGFGGKQWDIRPFSIRPR
jgi:hypothetical protein